VSGRRQRWEWRGQDLRCRLTVSAIYPRSEAVSLSNDGFNKTRLLRIIPEHDANLADRGVDTVVDVQKNALTPKALSNLFAGHQFAMPLE
jgi:hypothetical protein